MPPVGEFLVAIGCQLRVACSAGCQPDAFQMPTSSNISVTKAAIGERSERVNVT